MSFCCCFSRWLSPRSEESQPFYTTTQPSSTSSKVDLMVHEGEGAFHRSNVSTHPSSSSTIHFQDNKKLSKYPIHSTFQADAQDKNGNTALHFAAQKGDIEAACLLITANDAAVSLANDNGDCPFDLAFQSQQDSFIHYFLRTNKKLKRRRTLEKTLIHAKREDNIEEQIFTIICISNEYIEKEEFVLGAKILNSAFALLKVQKHNPIFEKYLIAKLEGIEQKFLASKRLRPYAAKEHIIYFRNRIKHARENSKSQLEENVLAREILTSLTKEFKDILKELIGNCQSILGPPPVKWACIGMGSMARGEMCPYSDLEFAFLLEEETPEALNYFRLLSQLLEVQIINLGETPFLIFGENEPSPTPNGFCLDSGGNTPLGIPGLYELISTPKNMAQFLTSKRIKETIILANALSNTCFITGDEELSNLFNQEKTVILDDTSRQLSFTLLEGHLLEFSPNLSHKKEKLRRFGIKRELYRPFQEILGTLALFYRLKQNSTFDRVAALQARNIFSSTGVESLYIAINRVLSLRLEAHLFYADEKEFLCHGDEGEPFDPHLLLLTEKHIAQLKEIYKVLIPFHRQAEDFYGKQGEGRSFQDGPLYSDDPQAYGALLEKLGNFHEAKEAYQQEVALNPNNIWAILSLSHAELEVENGKNGLKRAQEALKIVKEKFGDQYSGYPHLGTIYNNMGLGFKLLKKDKKALKYLNQAIIIGKRILGIENVKIAYILQNIAIVHCNQKNYKLALKSLNESLSIFQVIYGSNHAEVKKNQQIIRNIMMAEYSQEMRLPLASTYEELDALALSGQSIGIFVPIEKTKKDKPKKAAPSQKMDRDNPEFKYRLGQRYKKGISLPQDTKNAFGFFREATSQGHVKATYQLGNCYSTGFGTDKDTSIAIQNWELAANKGHAKAQMMMSWCYAHGEKVNKDYPLSLKYLKMAANQENPLAYVLLSECYEVGEIVEKDLPLALHYLRLAVNFGNPLARYKLGLYYARGIGVQEDMRVARQYWSLAADQGHTEAQVCLAYEYENGFGGSKDPKLAVKYWLQAASKNDAEALCRMGALYASGKYGIKRDHPQAVAYWQRSVDQGHAGAQFYLGMCYARGDGVEKNLEIAIDLWEASASQGYEPAQQILQNRET